MWDVIIIGGGPAGAAAAIKAAKLGLKTLLLEWQARNRYKPCAGGISVRTSTEIENLLGKRIPDEVIETRTKEFRLIHGTRIVHLPIHWDAFAVFRTKFDQWLRDEAESLGATIKYEHPVKEIIIKENSVEIKHSHGTEEGKLVIGALGASMIHQFYPQLGIKEKPLLALCVQREFKITDKALNELDDSSEIYLGSDICLIGYYWIFTKKRSRVATVGFGSPRLKSVKMEILNRISSTHPIAKRRLEGAELLKFDGKTSFAHPVPLKPLKKPHGNRFMLVGDAAGLVDKFVGEGISSALISGRIAAEVAANATENNRFDEKFLAQYLRKLKLELLEDLECYSKLGSSIYITKPDVYDKVLTGLFDLLEEDKEFREIYTKLMLKLKPCKKLIKLLNKKKRKLLQKIGFGTAIKAFLLYRWKPQ